jgi:hypothetical protein
MQLVRADGKPVAALFDYASHATSLGPKNLVISGDVLGIAEQYVERVLGDNLIAPAFAGASGDIDPWYRVLPEFNTRGGRVPAPELMGMLLGTEVLQVLSNMETASGTPEIESQFTTLQLPAKDGEGDNGADQNPTKSLNVTVARVGNIGFVGLGCELLTELGMAIKAQSPFEHTFVITHCNGGAGYLAPAKLFADGGYEIRTTRFAPAAADLFVKQTVALLRELKD